MPGRRARRPRHCIRLAHPEQDAAATAPANGGASSVAAETNTPTAGDGETSAVGVAQEASGGEWSVSQCRLVSVIGDWSTLTTTRIGDGASRIGNEASRIGDGAMSGSRGRITTPRPRRAALGPGRGRAAAHRGSMPDLLRWFPEVLGAGPACRDARPRCWQPGDRAAPRAAASVAPSPPHRRSADVHLEHGGHRGDARGHVGTDRHPEQPAPGFPSYLPIPYPRTRLKRE
jgi:hypothetical protein